jgi:hypothetical protein
MNESTEIITIPEAPDVQAPAPSDALPPANPFAAPSMWNNTKLMQQAWKMADMLSKSTLIPESYRNKPADCLLAIDMANRANMPPIFVLQNLYIVKGKPGWSGQACIAMINNSPMFTGRVEFTYTGTKGTPSFGCYAQMQRRSDGAIIKGTEVTMQLAHDEGWATKDGSKWKTMPEQMLAYRAASFFARLHCPEALMGLQTADEVVDVHGNEPEKSKTKLSLEAQ